MSYRARYTTATILLAAILPTSTFAYCISPRSYGSFEAQVGRNLDYLLCLHNEHVTRLNSHANMLNTLSDGLASVRHTQTRTEQASVTDTGPAAIIMMREAISLKQAISAENARLVETVVELDKRLEELERRIEFYE